MWQKAIPPNNREHFEKVRGFKVIRINYYFHTGDKIAKSKQNICLKFNFDIIDFIQVFLKKKKSCKGDLISSKC